MRTPGARVCAPPPSLHQAGLPAEVTWELSRAFSPPIPPNFPPPSSRRALQRSRVTLASKPSSGFHGHQERSPSRTFSRHSEALPSTPLPALLLGTSEGPLFQGPAQCHFLQEALQTSQSALVSASSRYSPHSRDAGSGHTSQPLRLLRGLWGALEPPPRLLLPRLGGGASPVRRARQNHRAALEPRMARSRASWGRSGCWLGLGLGPSWVSSSRGFLPPSSQRGLTVT